MALLVEWYNDLHFRFANFLLAEIVMVQLIQPNDNWLFLVQEYLVLSKLVVTGGLPDSVDLDVKLVVKLVDAKDVLFVWSVE